MNVPNFVRHLRGPCVISSITDFKSLLEPRKLNLNVLMFQLPVVCSISNSQCFGIMFILIYLDTNLMFNT